MTLPFLLVGAQAQEPSPDLADWEAWTRAVVSATRGGDVETMAAALQRLDALRSTASGETERRAQAAWARLAWRAAGDARALAHLATSAEDLLARAIPAAERGGCREDVGHAMLQLALRHRDFAARRRLLLQAAERDLGALGHGPWVLLAQLDLVERRFGDARAHLERAEAALPRSGSGAWLVDTFHATRALEALQYGLLDVARRSIGALQAEASPDIVDRLRLCWALAAEDFPTAREHGERILARGGADDAAEVERLVAMATFRALRVPLAQDRAALARLEHALDRPATGATRVQILLDLAYLHVEAGELAAAQARLGEASAALATVAGRDLVELQGRLATVRAHVALAPTAPPIDLAELRGDLVRACDGLLQQWQAMPVRKGGLGFLQFAERRDAIAALIAVEQRLHPDRPELALAHLMRAQALGTLARRQDLATGDPRDVQARLAPERGGLLVFLPCSLGECLFVVTRDRIAFHRLPRRASLLHDLRALRESLLLRDELTPADSVAESAARVAEQVLPREVVRELAHWEECVVVGRELLCGLPFEVLPGPRSRWLGCDVAVSYLPSLPYGLHRSRDGRAAGRVAGRCTLVAVTEHRGAARPREAVSVDPRELDAILAPWPDPTSLRAGSATLAELARTEVGLGATTILLGHGCDGLATASDERSRGVILADGFLSCAAVEELAGKVSPLVVLAVCRGVTGPTRLGDDAGSHLAGAFLFAGAEMVLAADAELDARATLALLRAFARHRVQGLRAPEALRRARSEVAEVPEFAHPALFALLGAFGHEAEPPPPVAGRPSSRGWLFAVVGLALAAAVAWRRPGRPAGSA